MIGYAIQPFLFCFKDLQNTITFILCLQKFPNSVKNSQMCQNTKRIINAVKIKYRNWINFKILRSVIVYFMDIVK